MTAVPRETIGIKLHYYNNEITTAPQTLPGKHEAHVEVSLGGGGEGKVNFCSGGWKMLPLGSAVWTRGGGVPSSPSPRPPAAPSSWWPPPSTACPGCSRTVVGARWTRSCCGGFASPPLLASSRPHTRWHATAATHTG